MAAAAPTEEALHSAEGKRGSMILPDWHFVEPLEAVVAPRFGKQLAVGERWQREPLASGQQLVAPQLAAEWELVEE